MSQVLQRVVGIIRREVGTDVLLFDPRNDSLHVLNVTGAFVWDQLGESRTDAELEAALRSSFEVGDDCDVVADIARVVDDLTSRGLVLRVPTDEMGRADGSGTGL